MSIFVSSYNQNNPYQSYHKNGAAQSKLPAGSLAGQSAAGAQSSSQTRRELSEQVRGLHKTQTKNPYSVRIDSKGNLVGEGIDAQDQDRLKAMLKQQYTEQHTYAVSAQSLVESLFAPKKTESSKEELLKTGSKYNFKEVSNKIRSAKNSVSAGQAVLAAKRKVLEMKRKLASGDEDSEEIQLAINHAKQMELTAKKKKRHIEMEEMTEVVSERDERTEKEEDAAQEMQSTMVELEQDKIADKQTDIMEERTRLLAESIEEAQESGEEISDEMLKAMDEMAEAFGEEEMKALEEMSEMLDGMEIIDPHMSEEDLEKLKKKHRNSEEKALMKADMEYLKEYIKLQMKQNASMPGTGSTSPVGSAPAATPTPSLDLSAGAMPQVSFAGPAASMPSMDIQV